MPRTMGVRQTTRTPSARSPQPLCNPVFQPVQAVVRSSFGSTNRQAAAALAARQSACKMNANDGLETLMIAAPAAGPMIRITLFVT